MAARLRCERLLRVGVAADEDFEAWWTNCNEGKKKCDAFQVLLASLEGLVTGSQAAGGTTTNELRSKPDHETWLFQLRRLEECSMSISRTCFRACAAAPGQTGHSLLVDREGGVWSYGNQGVDGRCASCVCP